MQIARHAPRDRRDTHQLGRTGNWLSADWWGVRPDITPRQGLRNGFPMSALVVKEEHAWALPKIAPSTTFGGNPMPAPPARDDRGHRGRGRNGTGCRERELSPRKIEGAEGSASHNRRR
ncbi:MAG: aminotransferase class III-fold pyridoxal phosphate-dependent enzyme [Deltaproteobacteria bacterium]|nr:aminotransferase class III-fold pyridoxal phosphate-dependent enzyme [Deltaproteobacteria bacterium]